MILVITQGSGFFYRLRMARTLLTHVIKVLFSNRVLMSRQCRDKKEEELLSSIATSFVYKRKD